MNNAEGFSVVAGPIGTFKVRVLPRPKPPVVKSVRVINGGSGLAVRFSEDVGPSLNANELTLQSEDGQTIDAASMAMTWDAAHNTATWTFPGSTDARLPAGRTGQCASPLQPSSTAAGVSSTAIATGSQGMIYLSLKPLVVKPTTHPPAPR